MRCGLADPLDWRVRNLLRSRTRVNSAIYISPIYQDAHIRNGISVRPIRKARSADYLPKYDYSSWANYQQFSLPLSGGGGGGACGSVCAGGGVGVGVGGGGVGGSVVVCTVCGGGTTAAPTVGNACCVCGAGTGGGGGGVCGNGAGGVCVNGCGCGVHQRHHIKRFKLPTVSISIASDSDKALNELLI